MKYIKKVINIVLIVLFLVPMFVAPYVADAADKDNMTLKELKEELAISEAKLNENNTNIQLTEAQIKAIKNNLALIGKQIDESTNNIIQLKDEIIKLEEEIAAKKVEIDKIVNFLQLSSGESEYLEYTFGAKTFTDFIYRIAITEQLTDYNDKLIKDYDAMIVSNKQKQIEMNKKIEELKVKQIEATQEAAKLETQASRLSSDKGSLEKGIEATKTILNELSAKGCREDETAVACSLRVDGFPVSSSGMIRPLAHGAVSSEFGPRWGEIHGGIDIGVPVGTPVYAVASGIVTDVRDYGGTGLSIHIRHIINGKYYTSVYQHLSVYEVSRNQVVYRGQEIALSGNTGKSFGAHLHFALFYGWAGYDYPIWDRTYFSNGTYYSKYETMWFNPRFMIDFPSLGSSF